MLYLSRTALLLSVCTFCVLQWQEAVALTNADVLINEGYAAMEAGSHDSALAAFGKILEADSDNIEALLGQAMIHSELQNHSAAFTAYNRITLLSPQNAFAWNGRGIAAFNLEDFDTALKSFENATNARPTGFFFESLAWTHMCRGEFDEAAKAAKRASLMYDQHGEKTVYPLLIAYFAYLEANDQDNAQRALSYAAANNRAKAWPLPVLEYLRGKVNKAEMISHVTSLSQETEAHTYIGLKLRSEGAIDSANQHLDWVSRRGDSTVFEYTLARAIRLQSSVAKFDPAAVTVVD